MIVLIGCNLKVIEAMKPYALVNGAFLVRKSFSKSGVLTVSVM